MPIANESVPWLLIAFGFGVTVGIALVAVLALVGAARQQRRKMPPTPERTDAADALHELTTGRPRRRDSSRYH